MVNYQGKNIIIIGLGITGLSCVDYFLGKKVIPKVIDTRHFTPELDKLDKRVNYHLGGLDLNWILDADLIVVSPGIALSTPELIEAANRGIEIIGDIELFCREINQQKDKSIVAITGSNGKTTVTTLTYEIVKKAGQNVGVGGNIGEPALSLLKKNHDIYILELSSFQLETTFSLQTTVATILNISEDHMDRYPEGLMQYVQAKQKIYHNATYALFNHDDHLTQPNVQNIESISFGKTQGDYHLDDQLKQLAYKNDLILKTSAMRLKGLHNFMNALAALAIADKLKINRSISKEVIAQFSGLPHRFELVLEKKGIQWINDSKATNVGSTEAALKSVIYTNNLYLLLGGDGKSADFSPLIAYLQSDHIRVFCFGRDRNQLSTLAPQHTTITETLEQSMKLISQQVQLGDVVLLSPACASLDQFKNYMERGDKFTCLAKELTGDLCL